MMMNEGRDRIGWMMMKEKEMALAHIHACMHEGMDGKDRMDDGDGPATYTCVHACVRVSVFPCVPFQMLLACHGCTQGSGGDEMCVCIHGSSTFLNLTITNMSLNGWRITYSTKIAEEEKAAASSSSK
jgi:hypothetical protein